jgi:hypothetical protein
MQLEIPHQDDNKYSVAENFIVTSIYIRHVGSRWYTLDLNVVTSIHPTVTPRLPSQRRRNYSQLSVTRKLQLS